MYVINHVFKITFLLWGLSNCSRWSTHWWVEGGLGPKIWDLNRPSSNRSNCGLTRRFVWDGQQTVRFQPRQFLDYDKTETDRSWDTHISRLARRVDRIFGVIFTPMYQCSWQDLIRLAGSDLDHRLPPPPPSLTPPDPGSLPSITKELGSRMWAPEMIEFVPESMIGSKAW